MPVTENPRKVSDGESMSLGGQMARISKSFVAYGAIKDAILSGTLPAGTKLVITRIASDLDMSPIPVREAIRRLEAEGMVRYSHNLGAQVAPFDGERRREMTEYEQILEEAAVRLASGHASSATIATATDLCGRTEQAWRQGDPSRFLALNQRLHQLLCAACPNRYVRERLSESWAKGLTARTVSAQGLARAGAGIVSRNAALVRLLTAESGDGSGLPEATSELDDPGPLDDPAPAAAIRRSA